jgi:DnaJ like chaperone protein
MKNYAKWIGGGLGFALGGPIGALLGFAVGTMIENTTTEAGASATAQPTGARRPRRATAADFEISLLVLTAAVMRADGKVVKSELNYVKRFFVQQFGESRTAEHLGTLRELLKQPFDLRGVAAQIRDNMEHPLRLQLLHYLFGIARADGGIDDAELRTLEDIAQYMGISHKDFDSIKGMFGNTISAYYKVLEIEENADEAEVKKAYRRMAQKYHPDKVSTLGEEFQQAAHEKFQKVHEAYEAIMKHRGFK